MSVITRKPNGHKYEEILAKQDDEQIYLGTIKQEENNSWSAFPATEMPSLDGFVDAKFAWMYLAIVSHTAQDISDECYYAIQYEYNQ